MFLLTNVGPQDPVLPVHQVPDPGDHLAPGVEHEDPRRVLGQPRHHHQVVDHVQVGLPLEHDGQCQQIIIGCPHLAPVLEPGQHGPVLLDPDDHWGLRDGDWAEDGHNNAEADQNF